jgi:hypothetical protein
LNIKRTCKEPRDFRRQKKAESRAAFRLLTMFPTTLIFGVFAFTRSGGMRLRKRQTDRIGFSFEFVIRTGFARIADDHLAGLFAEG